MAEEPRRLTAAAAHAAARGARHVLHHADTYRHGIVGARVAALGLGSLGVAYDHEHLEDLRGGGVRVPELVALHHQPERGARVAHVRLNIALQHAQRAGEAAVEHDRCAGAIRAHAEHAVVVAPNAVDGLPALLAAPGDPSRRRGTVDRAELRLGRRHGVCGGDPRLPRHRRAAISGGRGLRLRIGEDFRGGCRAHLGAW
mmetsp:Transcript_49487/g.123030  ORF Transcript_49487/g.123030 Transcript_49487/m.123030 type:complete len:200 (+) Transcript_49487:1525-2124(+)